MDVTSPDDRFRDGLSAAGAVRGAWPGGGRPGGDWPAGGARGREAGLDRVPPLSPSDAAAYEQGLALRALAKARSCGWVAQTVEAALHAAHPFPRGEARIALQFAPTEAVVPALLGPLTSEHRRLRRRAMTLLPRLEAAEVVRQMREWLPAASSQGKRAACIVLAALGQPGAELLTLLSEDADPAVARRAARGRTLLADRAAAAHGDPPKTADRSDLRPFGLQPPESHSGTPDAPARPRSFAVAAFNFSYGVNLGVLIRSAEAAGAEAVWIVGRDFYYRPATKGSDGWLPVEVIASPQECLERARGEGFSLVALQQGPEATPLFEAEWPERPLIVAGNEGDGLPDAFLRACELQISLPVYGRIDSLNVSVAASVAMYAFRASQHTPASA